MKTFLTDVVIIGTGAAGCFAAIQVRECGAQVIVLEKGTTIRSSNAGGGKNDVACQLTVCEQKQKG